MSDLIRYNRDPFEFLPSVFDPFTPTRRLMGCGLFSEPPYANYSTKETETSHFIKVAVPGHDKKSVSVSAENDRLTITATSDKDGFDAELIQDQEFKFKLPKNCDLENIEATLKNGLLTIELKKLDEKPTSGKIEVKVN